MEIYVLSLVLSTNMQPKLRTYEITPKDNIWIPIEMILQLKICMISYFLFHVR